MAVTAVYRGRGERKLYTAGADIAAKDVVELDNELGVAIAAIANGDEGTLSTAGDWELPAKSADTWDDGAALYWDAGNEELTDTASGNQVAGTAIGAKAALATVARVLLNDRTCV